MIKLILPSPLLTVALFVMWLLLNHTVSPGHMVLGAIFGVLIPIVTRGLRPLPVKVRHPWTILKLAARVVHDTSVSNFQVVRFLMFPSLRKHRAEFVYIPLDLRDPNGLAVLAMITCITPGTAWAEISRDRSMLLMHVLEADDHQRIIDHVKNSYERPLMEIFE
ncbi:MAG: Na+/H+ antiporter subunit E [Comamonas sp.]|nr:Na+/H+ antiporter subunit E [Candidatus Comamonas equi]